MKAIKKWLFDKEGLFIIITWWIIAFVIFTIMLGTSANSVSKNLKITRETSSSYVEAFIESGDNVIPYNEKVASVSVGKSDQGYKLDIRQYNEKSVVKHEAETTAAGAGSSKVKVAYDLEKTEVYYISYNYTKKTLSIQLVETITEVAPETYPISLKKTDSGSIHVLWNSEDTGEEITAGSDITIGKEDDHVVVNGVKTNVGFYEKDPETGKDAITYDKKSSNAAAKVVAFELIVEYKTNTKEYTKQEFSVKGLSNNEMLIVGDAANFFTQMIEASIGISSSSYTLTIVSAVVDVVLLISGVVGIILIKRSKED